MFDHFDPRDRDDDPRDDYGIYDPRWNDDPRDREDWRERERDRDRDRWIERDNLAVRQGFEPWIQVLARITV